MFVIFETGVQSGATAAMSKNLKTEQLIGQFRSIFRANTEAALPSQLARASRLTQLFGRARGGSTAILFAIAIVPIVALAGMGMDYGRAHQAQNDVQTALDAAALIAIKGAASATDSQINQRARQAFTAGIKGSMAENVQANASYNRSTSTIDLRAQGSVSTTLLQLIGRPEIAINVRSQATAGLGKLELAMVLDNTGSMSSNSKIQTLIAASHQLLTTLEGSAGASGAVKVSIVPFDTHVNIGLTNLTEPWMDWSFYNTADPYGTGADNQNSATTGCTSGNANGDVQDNGTGKCKTKAAQAFNASWTGCVIDRDQPYDIDNSAPTTDPATFYPALDCTLAPLLPLTSDWTTLHQTVDLMHASGATDLTVGLVWGWNMLTEGVPMSAATAPQQDTKRVIVFLTDGVNTKNAWTTNAPDIDARTNAVCNNIKADGVQIFTIRVMNGNAALLQSCASDPSMFIDVTQPNQMLAAFDTFAQSLVQPPHLTR